MKYLLGFFIMLANCNENNSEKVDLKETKISKTWLLYGMPESIAAKNFIAKEYGFVYKQVAGCVVDNISTDSFDFENKNLDSLLKIDFGNNWQIEFDAKVKNVEKQSAEAQSLLNNYTPNLIRITELHVRGLRCVTKPKYVDLPKAICKIESYFYEEGSANSMLYLDKVYEINLDKKSIKVIR
jgi:hypothetical protein